MLASERIIAPILLTALTLLTPPDASACSKIPFSYARSPDIAHFIASATSDTVLAGAGAVDYRLAPGHFGPATERPIHGQVVELRRTGGLAAERLDGRTRAVLVPWDYAADCTPTPWARSARWIEFEDHGLYVATLRDPEFWAGGLPTFDIHIPQYQPFPQRFDDQDWFPTDAGDLTVDELFALYDVLPAAPLDATPEEAIRPLLDWVERNPVLAGRFPAPLLIGINLHGSENARIRGLESPVAGTYRLAIQAPGRAPETIFLRTRLTPTGSWNLLEPADGADRPVRPTYLGYNLLAGAARTQDELPAESTGPWEHGSHGYIAVAELPEVTTDGQQVWSGDIDSRLLAIPDDPALHDIKMLIRQTRLDRRRAPLPFEPPARFTLGPDGAVRLRQVIELGDGSRITIEGERVSETVIVEAPGS